jgi:N-methylhydantoinase A
MLACYLAKALSMPRLLVPTTPGVLSALGGLVADIKNDFVKTTYCDLDTRSMTELAKVAQDLETKAREWLASETGSHDGAEIQVSADMRYRGQSFEIDTPLDPRWLAAGDIGAVTRAFHQEHERLYGHGDASAEVQVVALRLVITASTPKPELRRIEGGTGQPVADAVRDIWLEGRMRKVPVYQRRALLAGHAFEGPAIVAQDDCTTCVLPGFKATVDVYGNLELIALEAAN